jgi:hypothetical protein
MTAETRADIYTRITAEIVFIVAVPPIISSAR